MPLSDLREFGQSAWYDYISRQLLASGELLRMIARDGLAGVTSNPTILEAAVNKSPAYDEEIAILARRGMSAEEIYTRVVTADIAEAADILSSVYAATAGADGYVSLEVSPTLAHDADGTVRDAIRLWKLLDRENVMIKIPGTEAGFTAIRRVIAEGINVNVTLLFSLEDYEQAAHAYIEGLKDRAGRNLDLKKIASVASVFISRIDTSTDKALDAAITAARDPATKQKLEALRGKSAIANAKLVYQRFQEIFGGLDFQKLEGLGARRQRPLWASTGTKNPKYSDVLYIEELVGPDTVNTMPPGALTAFRDHGKARPTIQSDLDGARTVLGDVRAAGVDFPAILKQLKVEALGAFEDSFATLMLGIDTKRKAALLRGRYEIAGSGLGKELDRFNTEFQLSGFVSGIWGKKAELWSEEAAEQKHIVNRLGWLESPEVMAKNLSRVTRFAGRIRHDGIRHVVLLGMGGSSLAPEVMRAVLSVRAGWPSFTMLDSTDPAAIRAVAETVRLEDTLFVVSSKSGTTIEPNALAAYFASRLRAVGVPHPGRQMVAITDDGTPLHEQAQHDAFREIFVNPSDIGGRYSALSFFGMVPAALMGLDVASLLAWGRAMALLCGRPSADGGAGGRAACAGSVVQNPGVALGIVMGAAARMGRDKLTLVTAPRLEPFGLWVEQLIAESTGKKGTGIVPVAGESLGAPETYGHDRLFVRLRLHGGDADEHARDGKVERLRAAGHPIVTIHLVEPEAIGAEFVRWEIATATAGALLGINPFDEPNVQQAKDATKSLLRRYVGEQALPAPAPHLSVHGTSLTFSAAALDKMGRSPMEPTAALRAFVDLAQAGDYFGILAYLPLEAEVAARLRRLRETLRDDRRIATTLGFGPRYLHSTGQLHKGGANAGQFVVITADPKQDIPIPGEPFTFGVLELAQALGDFASLEASGRRALRVHLGTYDIAALDRACALLETAARARP